MCSDPLGPLSKPVTDVDRTILIILLIPIRSAYILADYDWSDFVDWISHTVASRVSSDIFNIASTSAHGVRTQLRKRCAPERGNQNSEVS